MLGLIKLGIETNVIEIMPSRFLAKSHYEVHFHDRQNHCQNGLFTSAEL